MENSGIEDLRAIEYKERKARENHKRLTVETAELEQRKERLEHETAQQERAMAKFEQQRKEKKKALDEESGSALMSGAANLFCKGCTPGLRKRTRGFLPRTWICSLPSRGWRRRRQKSR